MAEEKKREERKEKVEEKGKKEYGIDFYFKILYGILVAGIIVLSILLALIYQALQGIKVISSQTTSQNPLQQYLQSLPTVPLPNVTDANIAIGNNSNAIMYEFLDAECPYCQLWDTAYFPEIYSDYIETGKLTYIVMYFPLYQIHPYTNVSNQYIACVTKYYGSEEGLKYLELVYQNFTQWQNSNVSEILDNYVAYLGLNATNIYNCVESGETYNVLLNDLSETSIYGFSGTPSFLIAVNVNQVTYSGIQEVQQVLNQLSRYGLSYQIMLSNDHQYLLIGFSGALPNQIFDQIFSALNI